MLRFKMKTTKLRVGRLIILLASVACSGVLFAEDSEYREWKDSSGKHSVSAVLVSHENDKVKLRREDGRMIEMPISKLSKEDQNYLKELDDNPFEEGLLEDGDAEEGQKKKTSEAAGFKLKGAKTRFDKFDFDVYVGDQTKVKIAGRSSRENEWKYVPAELPKAKTAKMEKRSGAPLLSDPRFNAFVRPSNVTVVPPKTNSSDPFYLSFNIATQRDTTYVARCDVVAGTSEIAEIPYADAKLFDISPDGKYGLFLLPLKLDAGLPKKSFLAIISLDGIVNGATIQPSVVFCPYYSEEMLARRSREEYEEIGNAYWVDSEHILTTSDKTTTLWKTSECRAERALNYASRAMAIDPSGTRVAILANGVVRIYDASTLESLGAVGLVSDGSGSIADFGASCAFSPSGEKILAVSGQKAYIVDLKSGTSFNLTEAPALDQSIAWGSDEYVLLDETGVDVNTGVPICHYSNLGRLNGRFVNAFGLVWTLAEKDFIGFEAPDQGVLDAIKALDVKKDFALYRGAKVAIKTQLNGYFDDDEVAAIIEKKALACGFEIDPNSKLTLTAFCRDTKETEEVTVGEFERERSRLDPLAIMPGSEKLKSATTMQLKIFEQGLRIDDNGKEIWKFGRKTVGPQDARRDPNKSLEEQVKEENRPTIDYYEYEYLPTYIAKEGSKGARAVLNVKVTDSGIVKGR